MTVSIISGFFIFIIPGNMCNKYSAIYTMVVVFLSPWCLYRQTTGIHSAYIIQSPFNFYVMTSLKEFQLSDIRPNKSRRYIIEGFPSDVVANSFTLTDIYGVTCSFFRLHMIIHCIQRRCKLVTCISTYCCGLITHIG